MSLIYIQSPLAWFCTYVGDEVWVTMLLRRVHRLQSAWWSSLLRLEVVSSLKGGGQTERLPWERENVRKSPVPERWTKDYRPFRCQIALLLWCGTSSLSSVSLNVLVFPMSDTFVLEIEHGNLSHCSSKKSLCPVGFSSRCTLRRLFWKRKHSDFSPIFPVVTW